MYTSNKREYIKMKSENKETYNYPFLSFGSKGFDIQQQWIVKNIIPTESFGIIYGASGTYKSFTTLDICFSIATGSTWNNIKVNQGAVLYVAAEGSIGIKRRIKALEIANSATANDIFILNKTLSPSSSVEIESIINIVNELEQHHNIKFSLIVFDTLSRCLIGDENTARDIGTFITGCELIIKQTKTTVLCVHHTGKDETKGCRGSSKLFADADFVFQQKKINKSELTGNFINTKQKDEELAPTFSMTLEKIGLGIYCDEGLPITSLARTQPATIQIKKNTAENPLLLVLREEFNGCCTRGELRNKCFSPIDGVKNNTANQQFKRAINALEDAGRVKIDQKSVNAHNSDTIKEILSEK